MFLGKRHCAQQTVIVINKSNVNIYLGHYDLIYLRYLFVAFLQNNCD